MSSFYKRVVNNNVEYYDEYMDFKYYTKSYKNKNVKSYIDINITINGKITISGKELNL